MEHRLQPAVRSRVAVRMALSSRAFRQTGITLIELMIVVSIAAILVGLAAPNLSEFYVRNRLDTGANEFMTALNLARSEAIRRGTPVRAQRNTGGASIWDWTPGWVIRDEASGEVIRQSGRIGAPMTLFGGQVTQLDVRYTSDGRAAGVSNFWAFILCYENQIAVGGRSRSRGIIVSESGRVQLAATDANGRPLKPPANQATPGQVAIMSCTTP